MTPDEVIAAGQGLRSARPRRRRLPDRDEVGLHPAGRRQAALPRGQRRRVRAGHLQGHPADDGQPAHAGRGRHHRVVRDPRQHAFIYIRGEVAARRPPAAAGGRGGLRRRLHRQGHPRLRLRPRRHRPRRRGRLHLRRGDGAARLARGPSRPAAAAAAVPRRRRPVRLPDGRSTTSSRSPASRHHRATAPTGSPHGHREVARASRCTRCPGTSRGPASTRRRWASRCASCSTWPAASARATS